MNHSAFGFKNTLIGAFAEKCDTKAFRIQVKNNCIHWVCAGFKPTPGLQEMTYLLVGVLCVLDEY